MLSIEAAVDRDGTVTLTLHGELDSATTPDLDSAVALALSHARGSRVVVDISTLAFIGAAGFHALERSQHAAERKGREFVVVADAWKLRIAKLVCSTGLNIQLATDSGDWEMYALAEPGLYALSA